MNVAQLLVVNNADVNATDNQGWSPLHCACDSARLDVVQFLVSRGANLSITDKWNKSPLQHAQEKGHTAVVEYLKEQVKQQEQNEFQRQGEESGRPKCAMCMDHTNTNAAISPCGHVYCLDCISEVQNRGGDCPTCRRRIESVLRIYF